MEGEEEDLSLIMGLIIGQIFTSHFLGPGSDNSGLQRHLQLDCKPRTDQLVSQLAVPKYVKERCGGFLEIYGKKYFNQNCKTCFYGSIGVSNIAVESD